MVPARAGMAPPGAAPAAPAASNLNDPRARGDGPWSRNDEGAPSPHTRGGGRSLAPRSQVQVGGRVRRRAGRGVRADAPTPPPQLDHVAREDAALRALVAQLAVQALRDGGEVRPAVGRAGLAVDPAPAGIFRARGTGHPSWTDWLPRLRGMLGCGWLRPVASSSRPRACGVLLRQCSGRTVIAGWPYRCGDHPCRRVGWRGYGARTGVRVGRLSLSRSRWPTGKQLKENWQTSWYDCSSASVDPACAGILRVVVCGGEAVRRLTPRARGSSSLDDLGEINQVVDPACAGILRHARPEPIRQQR